MSISAGLSDAEIAAARERVRQRNKQRAKVNKADREKRKARIAAGLCVWCSHPPRKTRPGRTTCQQCWEHRYPHSTRRHVPLTAEERESIRQNYQRRKALLAEIPYIQQLVKEECRKLREEADKYTLPGLAKLHRCSVELIMRVINEDPTHEKMATTSSATAGLSSRGRVDRRHA